MKLIPVTELMIQEYQYFESLLTKEIFSQLDENSLRFADHIIGVSGSHSFLVYRVTVLVNDYRRKHGIKKSCSVLSTQLIDVGYVSLYQAIKEMLMIEIGIRK